MYTEFIKLSSLVSFSDGAGRYDSLGNYHLPLLLRFGALYLPHNKSKILPVRSNPLQSGKLHRVSMSDDRASHWLPAHPVSPHSRICTSQTKLADISRQGARSRRSKNQTKKAKVRRGQGPVNLDWRVRRNLRSAIEIPVRVAPFSCRPKTVLPPLLQKK